MWNRIIFFFSGIPSFITAALRCDALYHGEHRAIAVDLT